MTPKELIKKLVSCEGDCTRLCAYCPEDFNTAEVKKCVEKMIETNYKLQLDRDNLLDELVKIRAAFREVAGYDYKGDEE